ncbi:MAG: hypothetical protein UX17_C0014G0006 [Parcubacteria group bacterium GW2011_GWC2_45_7]|nr:MAG: hypothetical protein UX17_C0014G0006 [Parcubacteria group bacterium GW2011_GWC2_45_7]KKU74036.1 MAG: hypothetical protein UX98_C0002G0066 [Parcubacteria group bacterium GW2011_GWA2_47_26]
MPPVTTQTKTKVGVGTKVAVALLIVGGAVAAAFAIPRIINKPMFLVRLLDLTVTSISPDLTTKRTTVRVQNIGSGPISSAPSGPSASRLKLEAVDADGMIIGSSVTTVDLPPSIAAGSEWVAAIDLFPAGYSGPESIVDYPVGMVAFRATVDYDNVIRESNEDNNILKLAWSPPAPVAPVASRLSFTLAPTSPSGAGVGVNEVLRFNVTNESPVDAALIDMHFDGAGTDNAGSRWPETGPLMRSWRLYDQTDLSTALGDLLTVPRVLRWDGANWNTTDAEIEFSGPGFLLISAGTTRTLILKVDTIGASAVRDDLVRFDLMRVTWVNAGTTGPLSGAGSPFEPGVVGTPLVTGNTLSY